MITITTLSLALSLSIVPYPMAPSKTRTVAQYTWCRLIGDAFLVASAFVASVYIVMKLGPIGFFLILLILFM